MPGAAGRVFGLIIIEGKFGGDFGHAQARFRVTHHRDGEFAAGHEFLHHHLVGEVQVSLPSSAGGRLSPLRMMKMPTEEPSFTGLTT